MLFYRIRQVAFAVALILLAFNISGFFIPLRNPEIYKEKETCFPNDITLTEADLWKQISRTDLKPADYLANVTTAISDGIACYWYDSGIEKYNLHIPASENYLLYVAGIIRPQNYRKFVFCDYKKAIRRGVGHCDQHAIIFAGIAKHRGIAAKIVGLSGHVVATAEALPGQWWMFDADYGVTIRHSLQQVEANPDLVIQPYQSRGFSEATARHMADLYGREGNFVRNGVEDYFPIKKLRTEKASYFLIWAIPAVLLLFSLFTVRYK